MNETPTPAIMVQGTSSNAGKSFVTAALCRIFADAGLAVMPFKAQNMSSRAYRLPDGRRMSESVVVQALAARQQPDPRMNPVLLMPCSDTGSDLVLLGHSHGVMSIAQYTAYKESTAFPAALEAYRSLAAQADLMVLEGAGSPAEINLKAHDIVNMRMAAQAGAAVILVGDIDRGGVFAHLLGTMELLSAAERSLVVGFVLNKFRGDASLLTPAMDEISARTGKPFLGVIPHYAGYDLPPEDSLAEQEQNSTGRHAVDADGLEASLDRMACFVSSHLDIPRIAALLGLAPAMPGSAEHSPLP